MLGYIERCNDFLFLGWGDDGELTPHARQLLSKSLNNVPFLSLRCLKQTSSP